VYNRSSIKPVAKDKKLFVNVIRVIK